MNKLISVFCFALGTGILITGIKQGFCFIGIGDGWFIIRGEKSLFQLWDWWLGASVCYLVSYLVLREEKGE